MKVLVIGLGSMGKRRVRNLIACGISAGDITGFDPRADRRAETADKYKIATVESIEQGWAAKPEALVISTPPDLHLHYIRMGVERKLPMFCEASVLPEHGREIQALVRANPSAVLFPSFTMRYFDGPKKVAAMAKHVGRPLFFTYHSGQYLPDWHPWEKIQDYYVSKPETGGCREIVPFELSWVTGVFGKIAKATGSATRSGDIDADIEDLYRCLFDFESGCKGVMVIDVLSRTAVRNFHLVGTEGNLTWDEGAKEVRLTRAGKAAEVFEVKQADPVSGYISPEYPYVQEITDFLGWAKNPSSARTQDHIDQDIHCLEVLAQVEASSRR